MKKTIRSLSAFFVFVALQNVLLGQNPPVFQCASDEVMQSRPALLEEQQLLEKAILQKNKNGILEKSATPPYSLPVVVHIVHDNGIGDITDAQVFDAIEQLNQAFAHQGYYANLGGGYDTQIQFCLAKRNPDGYSTNGITRTNSPLTNMYKFLDDQALKDQSRWNPNDYINVWVVNEIKGLLGPGVIGYAYLASAHGKPYDGIVCEAGYFGTSPKNNAVLIHEMGHYLNLYHTFQGGCENDDCLANGDRVCDTPPDQVTFSACGFNSCDTDADDASTNNPLTTDVPDLTENYMDYSPFECYHAFTEGQAKRMYDAIEMIRSSLLASEGCDDACPGPIVADFTASATDIMAGETVNFTNLTTGATDYIWKVNGVVFSSSQDASFTFNDVGQFEIELTATDGTPLCIEQKKLYISVSCPVVADFVANKLELEVGELFVATNQSENANTYQWQINGVNISSATDLTYNFSSPGIYTIQLDAYNALCSGYRTLIIEVITPNPCDSSTGLYWKINNANPDAKLIFEGFTNDGYQYHNVYQPSASGTILKATRNGGILWSKTIDIDIGGLGVIYDRNIMPTTDGGCVGRFIVGDFESNTVFRLDANGNTLWAKKTNQSIFMENRGFGDNLLFYRTFSMAKSFYATLFDKNGNELWGKAYELQSSIINFDNNVSLDGTYQWMAGSGTVMKLTHEGEIVFIKKYTNQTYNVFEIYGIAATPDNGFIAVGRGKNPNMTDRKDFFIIKAEAEGEIEWSKLIEQNTSLPQGVWGHEVFLKPDGSGYIATYSQVDGQSFWLSFSLDGILEHAKTYYWENGDPLHFNVLKNDGQLYATGNNPDDGNEMFLVPYNPLNGPAISCITQEDEPLVALDLNMQTADFAFTPIADKLDITDTSFVSTTNDFYLSRSAICDDQLVCPEICDNSFDDDEDGYVDCFDSDCQCFDGVDCNANTPVTAPIKAKVAWQSTENHVGVYNAPLVANLDPQNGDIPEIIVTEGVANAQSGFYVNKLLIFQGDGSNADNPDVLTISPPVVERTSAHAIADVNSDGIPELAVATRFGFINVYTGFTKGSGQPMSFYAGGPPTEWYAGHLAFADFDQDGTPEIYSGDHIYQFDLTNPSSPSLKLRGKGGFHSGFNNMGFTAPVAADILTVADCNGDPDCEGLELIAGAYIYSVDLDPLDGDWFEIKPARNLNELSSLGPFRDGYNHIADVNLDGLPDIITTGKHGTNGKPGFYIWDKNGLIAQFNNPDPNPINDKQFVTIAIANVFDDRTEGFQQDFPEIIFPSNSKLTCFNLQKAQSSPATPYWWSVNTQDPSRAAGPSCFDFNGDGFAEIAYRDENFLRVMYGGSLPLPAGVDNDRNWVKVACLSGTMDECPTVADVDGDGEAELLTAGVAPPDTYSGNDNRGRLWVFESDGLPWSPARAVWNQFNYFGANVNDDLTIPQFQQSGHLELPALGSGQRPLNTSKTQWPVFDNNFDPYFPVPDAIVQIDSSKCDADSLSLWLTVCNQGSSILPDSLPISFYQNDPTTSASSLLGTTLTSAALPIDSCFSFSLKIAAIYNTPISVLVNDNGTLPTPFNLTEDFPNTNVLECDYENNLTQIEIPYQSPTLDLGPDIVSCSSSTNTLDAGAGFVKYQWQDGSVDQIFTAWEIGKYWVDAWDICGFKHSDTIVISLDQGAAFDLGNDLEICEDEKVNLSVSGFSNVKWWPTEGLNCSDCPSVEATPTTTLTYHATGWEGNCFASDSIRITVLPKPNFILESTLGECNEPALITATPIGGTNLDFIWSNGSMDTSTQVSQSGIYAVTATNAACSVIDSILVEIPVAVSFSASISEIPCFGETGGIGLVITQATLPYSVLWSNGETADTLLGVASGKYSVTVTDADGCEAMETFILEDPPELTLAPIIDHISCNNDPGSIALYASGGTGQLSYSWSNGESMDSISTSTPGDYSVTVTDSSGCEIVFAQNIGEEEPLSVSVLLTAIQCPGDTNGSAALLPLNGMPPFDYLWENGQTDSIRTELGNGQHAVTIADALGCIKEIEFSLLEPDSFGIEFSATPVLCFGEMNGIVTALVTGGSPDYSYLWDTGATSPSIGDLSSGQYHLTITDDHGCQDTASILLEEPPLLQAAISAIPSALCPSETGSLSAIPMGGTPPYSYLWNNIAIDSFLTNVPPGMYEVLVSDSNGCEASSEVILEEISPPISVQDTIKAATGTTISDGAIHLDSIMGGTPPFSFLWSNGNTSQSITNLLPGIYSLTITDTEECSETFEFEVGLMVGTKHLLHQGFEVSLFPNPAPQKGYGILSVKTISHQNLELELYDITGRLLRKEKYNVFGGHSIQKVQTPEVAGVYLLRIVGENGQQVFLRWIVSGK